MIKIPQIRSKLLVNKRSNSLKLDVLKARTKVVHKMESWRERERERERDREREIREKDRERV